MEGEDATQQATQPTFDRRRRGEQNSGFSDDELSDIICVLYPHSDSARHEVQRLARENCPHIIGRDQADVVEPDYDLEDEASRFDPSPPEHGNYAIILRLSSQLKDPKAGFAFGRNAARCDVLFCHDPHKRISNIHFRIFVNEHGNVMIEDQSTNGTFVDERLLISKPKEKSPRNIRKYVLSSGTLIKVFLHEKIKDLTFRVRIPRRDDLYEGAYNDQVHEFFARHQLKGQPSVPSYDDATDMTETIRPGMPVPRRDTPDKQHRSSSKPRPSSMGWTGSGKYNRVKMIGKGAFAVVYKATSIYDGVPYAAKELDKRRFIKNGVLDHKVENEMKIMQRVRHQNIVRYIETLDVNDRLLIIIMEYVPGGDLGKLISEHGPFPEDVTQTMSHQLLGALGYLHTRNITHRDVKPDNILIQSTEPLVVKLTDFGLSKMVDTEQTFLTTFCGTLLYCAPEVYTEFRDYDQNGFRNRSKAPRVFGQRYSHAVDIWSLGGVLFYTMAQVPPFPATNGISPSELLHKVMTTGLDTRPLTRQGVSESGIAFLGRMLQRRPETRAKILELETHPWLGGAGSVIQASQSYDEITDEELDLQPSQVFDELDRVSDSMDDEAEKENQGKPRLFGELGPSALHSSGALPSEIMHIPTRGGKANRAEVMGSHADEAYDSDESAASSTRLYRNVREASVSIAHSQSMDQLHSLVEDVASQSLGGDPTAAQSTKSLDLFTSSKRKPVSTNTSDEYDENTPPGKPGIKRLKSESLVVELSDETLEEFRLMARVPEVIKLNSGRQIDDPYLKANHWEKDTDTWHLVYPEMTQLQYDAFERAAQEGGEKFAPGKTPLWNLAMKYFPPTAQLAGRQNQNNMASTTDYPATALPMEMDTDDLPDTAPTDNHITVPVPVETTPGRALGMLEFASDSCIRGADVHITDSFISFGRKQENTAVYDQPQESRMPKSAFKILLWKDGFDPAKTSHPGRRTTEDDTYFYISSKATLGIRINGYQLPSSETKNHAGPSKYWTRLFDGDELLVWGKPESAPSEQTRLIFRCFWGASSKPRGSAKQLTLEPRDTARTLDEACSRTEDRFTKARRKEELRRDHERRKETIARERERTGAFEQRRKEAIQHLQARQALASASRRASPATFGVASHAGRG